METLINNHENDSDIVFSKPPTQYTKCGDINIAYQIFGDGDIDLIYIPGWVSNIDLMWSCQELVNFFNAIGKSCRLILFDKRGTGLSDRLSEPATLEERMEDIQAVMEAANSEKAVLFGHSEGGSVSALFAATYPQKVIALIAFGIFAKRQRSKNYPWAPSDQERNHLFDLIENHWGTSKMNLESLAPSKASDSQFMEWLATYFRTGASPNAAKILTELNTGINIIEILGKINVPTLIMQRTNDIDVKIEEGKYISEKIKNSKFIELPGSDHLFWVGDSQEVLQHIFGFINSLEAREKDPKELFIFLEAQLGSIKEISPEQNEKIKKVTQYYEGSILQQDSKSLKILFKKAIKAIKCANKFIKCCDQLGISQGIIISLTELSSKNVNTKTQHETSYLDQNFPEHGVVVTEAIKNLIHGSSIHLTHLKNLFDPSKCEITPIYQVTSQTDNSLPSPIIENQDCILQNVKELIDQNISNEKLSVEMLCKEIGVSERNLQRKIKTIANQSPIQLITSIRLQRSKDLLKANNYSIAEVAFQLGFSSPSYFSKQFRKAFGISPTTFVSENKQNQIYWGSLTG